MDKISNLFSVQPKPLSALSMLALLFCLLISQPVMAAFWIDHFTGEPEEYRLVRQGVELTIEEQMLLKTGDELRILSEAGELHLEQDDHDNKNLFILTRKNGAFRVPESSAPPGVIQNMIALGEEWFKKASEETKATRSLTSRGGEPVLISGASDLKNHLIAGIDSLTVYWSGGKPPYRIRLLDEDEGIILEQSDIQQNNITLTGITLSTGNYGLEVQGDSSSSYIALTVVEPDQAPPLYQKILASHAPEKVKQRYATLVLASEPGWLFQALQWAERYGLQDFKQSILMGRVPEPISE